MTEKILIIQTAFLGDLILSTPLFRAVKRKYPESELHVLVNKGTEQVLDGNPDIDRVIPIDKKTIKKNPIAFFRFAGKLRREKYDQVYSAHFSFRSSLLSWFSSAKLRVGYLESGFSFLHNKKVSRPKLGPHEVEKLFSLLYDDLSEYPKGRERRPFLYPKSSDVESFEVAANRMKVTKGEYIIIAPSSLWETKRMPEEKFASLISLILRKRTETVILIGSKADLPIEERIFQLLSIEPLKSYERARLMSVVGKTTLSELAVWIQNANAIVSNDSSPIHFASAFNVPTVMIYGATVPEFGYSTLSEKNKIMEVEGLGCRPCGIHGGRICPESHFRCMLDQQPQKLFESLEEILKSS
ncbi:lipopolysaccharide heptosyltransferase II [Leptospira ilyithenensis]|uniref:lipopolysaccharide heptosyltransferase II n=1 Tax=Leptospira ilyithenensis TaxID=2484901 RepID=A0A4R9LL76_9LEPT|nr:lipopolysaccharide heptosyltransferase II [Leptospira ilyithenensis]TGN08376.1 lipopolysaccharide heptosyltransferase II [Leptospira ilyithenensis]